MIQNVIRLFFFLLIITCSVEDHTISLNCAHLECSNANLISIEKTDSLVSTFNSWHEQSGSGGILFKSDKENYSPGEIVTLTIENNTENITRYYFPNENESARTKAFYDIMKINEENIDKTLVSVSPAISGQLSQLTENFSTIMLDAMDRYTCEELGYYPFTNALDPGEKLEYRVTFPDKPGYYVIMLTRYAPEGNNIGYYGFNKFEYSNVFKVNPD